MGKITIDTDLYEKLVRNATIKKEVAEYLKIDEPDASSKERLLNTIQGIQSAVTTAQRERDEARTEASNAKEEISRVRDQVTNLERINQGLSVSAKELREMNDKQGRVIGDLNTRIQELETANRELQKGATQSLTLGDVFTLLVKKMFTIRS